MRVDHKHCIRCGEPTNGALCVECDRDDQYDFIHSLGIYSEGN